MINGKWNCNDGDTYCIDKKEKEEEGIIKKVWNYFKTEMLTPLNILYFVLGILSEFFSFFKDIYTSIRTVQKYIQPCVDVLVKSYKLITTPEDIKEGYVKNPIQDGEYYAIKLDKYQCNLIKGKIDYYYEKTKEKKFPEKKYLHSFWECFYRMV